MNTETFSSRELTCPGMTATHVALAVDIDGWRERTIAFLLATTLIMNLVDAVLTLFLVRSGLAVEANPLMDVLIAQGSLSFMVGKLAIVYLGVALLWRFRHERIAFIGSAASFWVYSLTIAWHVHGFSSL